MEDTTQSPQGAPVKEKSWITRHPVLSIGGTIIVGLFMLSVTGSSQSTSTGASTDTGSNDTPQASTGAIQSSDTSAQAVADDTGISIDDINAAYPIAARYGLDSTAQAIVVQQAADLYAIKTQTSDSAVLTQAGLGSFDDTTDIIAHLVSAWSVSNSDIATDASGLFSAMTNGSISWNDLTSALITNGPKLSAYISLDDTAIQLAALSQIPTLSSSTIIDTLNSIGDSAADPTTPMNQYLGGTGSVRALLDQPNGLINTFQKISEFLQAHQN